MRLSLFWSWSAVILSVSETAVQGTFHNFQGMTRLVCPVLRHGKCEKRRLARGRNPGGALMCPNPPSGAAVRAWESSVRTIRPAADRSASGHPQAAPSRERSRSSPGEQRAPGRLAERARHAVRRVVMVIASPDADLAALGRAARWPYLVAAV